MLAPTKDNVKHVLKGIINLMEFASHVVQVVLHVKLLIFANSVNQETSESKKKFLEEQLYHAKHHAQVVKFLSFLHFISTIKNSSLMVFPNSLSQS